MPTIFGTNPGTTLRFPSSMPSIAASATSSGADLRDADAPLLRIGDFSPLGGHRPGAQHGARHPGSVQFLVDGFGERLDERLGGRVDRHAGYRLKSGDRRDVEHRARTAFDHAGQRGVRELHQRERVERHLLAFALDRQSVERPAGAEAGTVAQAGNRIAADVGGEFAARVAVS